MDGSHLQKQTGVLDKISSLIIGNGTLNGKSLLYIFLTLDFTLSLHVRLFSNKYLKFSMLNILK